jgi:hypothetical protein
MNEVNLNDLEMVLADQIPDVPVNNDFKQVETQEMPVTGGSVPSNSITQEVTEPQVGMVGQKLQNNIGGSLNNQNREAVSELIESKKLSRIGQRIGENAEYREGWLDVPKTLLGERANFYPSDWQFKIRPATVDAIRNWSILDDENVNSIDDVFNEILKTCLSITSATGPLPWGNIRSWDRFFFILLIREYTFAHGESKIEFSEDCVNCDNPVTYNLTSHSLDYELPDPEIMQYFDVETQTWIIDPTEYEINEEPITLYLPTLEKEANIKAWIISRLQEKKKVDNIFAKFLPWMANKISKDLTIATRQIRELEVKFKSWDTDMFSFVDEVVRNIMVTPATNLKTTCPICGEEVTAAIRFPNGIRGLFAMGDKRKKFGKK